MDRQHGHGGHRTRALGVAVATGVVVMLAMSASAIADSGNDDEQGQDHGLVPVAPPANGECQGPGCADSGTSPIKALLMLVGSGSGCADTGACFWRLDDFDGDKERVDEIACCQWFSFTDLDHFRSAKNRYGFRKVQTGDPDGNTSCMDPGDNRPDLRVSDRFRVGALGSHCS